MAEDRTNAGSIGLELEVDTSGLDKLEEAAKEGGEKAGKALEEGLSKGAEKAGDALADGLSEGAEKGADSAEDAVEKGSERIKKTSGKTSEKIKKDAENAGSGAKAAISNAAGSITGMFAKIAKAAAGAFAIKKLVSFGKEAIELGSDLSEVQNVVDVTFGNMSDKVDEFAKSAAMSYGLSETMAKKYTGTFGSMAKAFGFAQEDAYNMGTALTGLAGDVASFYNITQDEAYTKLKSVFTGETESLKDLGVVMTQTALDAYALANGFGKTTKDMTEAEKVALRFAFVQNQLSAASGDFARTSGGWANQVRILKLQFDSLKATIGQGLINVLLPVVRGINFVLGKLTTLANAFKSFTELITGNKSSGSGGGGALADGMGELPDATAPAADGLEGVSDAADDAADASTAAGKAAKKAAKDMRSLAGFDQITKLSEAADAGDDLGGSTPSKGAGGSGGLGAGGALGSAVDYGNLAQGDTVMDKLGDKFKGIIDRAKELAALFKKGFKIGFGDSQKKIDSIRAGLENIGKRLKEIFTDPAVVESANRMFDSFAYNAGRVAGSMASIGLSIANNLVSGISQYLDGSSDYIKDRLVGIFDSSAVLADLVGDVAQAMATIYDVLNGENATGCTAALIGIFSDGFLGITDLALRFGTDIISLITGPFVENAELIRTTIDNTLGPIRTILETIWQSVKDTVDKAIEVYNEHVHPMFVSLRDGFTEILETFLNGYNEYMVPVLEGLAAKFKEVWEEHVQPAINGIIELFGKVADLVKTVWEKGLQPFINWIAEKIWPVVAPIVQKLGEGALGLLSTVADVVTDITKVLGDLIDFVIDIVNGDWSAAWEDAKNLLGDAWDAMIDLVRGPVNTIIDFMQGVLDGAADMANGIADAFNNLSIEVPDWSPIYPGASIGFSMPYWNPPTLTRLAHGGFVKPNTPQLAMIGDNRTQGEIVSPEDKLEEMAVAAARAAIAEAGGGVSRAELESIINNAVMRIIAALAQVGFYIDGQLLARLVKKGMSELDYRYNPVDIT